MTALAIGLTAVVAGLAVAAWLVSAVAVALLFGRAIRYRDRQVPR